MRLIDAVALLQYLDSTNEIKDWMVSQYNADWIYSFIESAPAVDAVPVVRCGECKHSREKDEDEKKYLVDSVLICTSCDATDDGWSPVFPEHFCSYGERKDHE